MTTLEIANNGKTVEIPAGWEELDEKHLEQVLLAYGLLELNKISYDDFLLLSLYTLTGVKRSRRTIIKEKLLPSAMLAERKHDKILLAEELCSFLTTLNDAGQRVLDFNSVICPISVISISGRAYRAPGDLLTDISFGQFRAAISERDEYFRTTDLTCLHRMLAALYLSNSRFEKDDVDRNFKLFSKTPWWKIQIILLWFSYCIYYIQNETLLIEGREINFSELFPKGEQGDNAEYSGLGWTSILFSIAKEGLFGQMKETDSSNLFDILLYLYESHQIQQKYKK